MLNASSGSTGIGLLLRPVMTCDQHIAMACAQRFGITSYVFIFLSETGPSCLLEMVLSYYIITYREVSSRKFAQLGRHGFTIFCAVVCCRKQVISLLNVPFCFLTSV